MGQPVTGGQRDHPKRPFSAVGDTLLEIPFDSPHLVGHMGNAKNSLVAGLGKRVERRPGGVVPGSPSRNQLAHDVAIRIENTNFGNSDNGKALLPTRLMQKAFRRKLGRCSRILAAQDRR
jgi:hypothetical protein